MGTLSKFGYRSGPTRTRYFELGNTAISGGLKHGDMLVIDGAGVPYVTQLSAGDVPCGVSRDTVAAADVPSTDGDVVISGYTHPDALFEYPPDSGSVTTALVLTTMDTGGAQSINIDASADDCVYVYSVNTTRNTVTCKLNFEAAFAGIV